MEQRPIRLHLRRIRKSRGLTQSEFAKILGCNRSYLTQIENGAAEPSLSKLCQFAHALGLQVRDLLDERPCRDCPYLEQLAHPGIRLSGTPSVAPPVEDAMEHQHTLLCEMPRRTPWIRSLGISGLLALCLGL